MGFVAVILVITTTISLIAFERGPKEALQFLSHRTPNSIVGGQQGSPSYSFDLMATRDVDDLVIRFNFMARQTEIALKEPWNRSLGRDPEELIRNVPRIEKIKEALDAVANLTGAETYHVFQIGGQGRKIVTFDFTDAMLRLAGPRQMGSVYTVYAFEVDDKGNVSVYAGCRDFFFRRETAIQSIKIKTPSAVMCFAGVEGMGAPGCEPISDAPLGVVELARLKKGERVGVEVVLNSVYMFPHKGLLELITTESSEGRGPVIVETISGESV